MENRTKKFITTFLIGAVLLTGIVILINMNVNNINFGRADLTADKVYKISPSVGKILSSLEAPIEITYYVSSSEKMPTQWKNLERDVIDKLKELKLASKGMLDYTVFDPSAEEEKESFEAGKTQEDEEGLIPGQNKPKATRKKIAQKLFEKGVIPFGVQSTERDEFAVKRVYSSIVLSYLDRKEDVIEEVRPEGFGNLEYEIISRIYKLISNRRPKIAFYPSQPEMPQQQMQYRNQTPPDMYEQTVAFLKQTGYDVTRTNIKKDDPIPGDIQTMIVMMDQPLNERQMYEIDKLVHRGVRVIMGGQQFNFQITSSQEPGKYDMMSMPTRMNSNELTKHYGFEIENKIFMDRSAAFIQIPVYQMRDMGMFQVREQRYQPVSKPVIIKVNPENINSKLSISNKISNIFYLYGNRMLVLDDIIKERNIKVQTLFTSSNYSWIKQGPGYGPVDDTPPTSDQILKKQPLGILLEGKFDPKFADGNIPAWPAEPGSNAVEADEIPTEITGDPVENKIIAFGSSNIFKSDVIKSVPSHVALLRNCVDALTLGDDLINIRSKNIRSRRIKEISTMGKAVSKTFVLWFTPLLFIAAGIYLNVRSKNEVIGMNEKHLKILAGVFVFLLVFYMITKPRHAGVNLDEFVQTIVFGVAKEDIKTVEVYKETGSEEPVRLILKQQDEKWRIPTHFNARVQQTKMDRLLDDVLEMTGKVRSTDPKHHDRYKITDNQGLHILLKDETDKTLANLIIGKKTEDTGSGFIRFSDNEKVYFTDKDILSNLSIHGEVDTLTQFNQKTFVDLEAVSKDKNDLELVGLVSNGKEMIIKKTEKEVTVTNDDSTTTTQTEIEWVLVKGTKETALDQKEVDNFFRDVAKIRGQEIVDAITSPFEDRNKRQKYGMSRPSRYVVFKTPDQEQSNVIFGKEFEKDKGFFMFVQQEGLFYKVNKSNTDKIFKWMKDLPEKTK